MTSKHAVLTEKEFSQFELRPELFRGINETLSYQDIKTSDLRVLDWGCGRGQVVLKLLEMNVDAYGVDIDPQVLANGESLFRVRGQRPEERLQLLQDSGRTTFPSDFFHLVISDQVFEHVCDLDAVADELKRVTRPGGAGLHLFPSKWRFVEPHLMVPFVHWLPKNGLRRSYLRAMLGRIPMWPELETLTSRERAEIYYNYSVKKTYYRTLWDIRDSLERVGLEVRFLPPIRPVRRILKWTGPIGRRVWSAWHNTFHEVALSTRLP